MLRVVVIDDDASIRALLRAYLSGVGFEVAGEADDGLAGILETRVRNPDAVVLERSGEEGLCPRAL